MKTFLLLFACCTAIFQSFSQAPHQFNYQGVARYTGGDAIASKTIGLRFTIHSGSATGTVEYSERRTTTTDSRGLFNVAIGGPGAMNVTGNFANITWSSVGKFLQIEIDINNNGSFVNMGTTQLLSVPYALHSQTAGYAANSNFATSSSNSTNSIGSGSHFFETYLSARDEDEKLPENGWYTVKFDTKNFDDSNAYNAQTGEFTAKENGLYKFDVSLYAIGLNALGGGFFKNGALLKFFSPAETTDAINGYDGFYFNYTSTVKLNLGDKITFAIHTHDDIEAFVIRDLQGAPFNAQTIHSFGGYKIK